MHIDRTFLKVLKKKKTWNEVSVFQKATAGFSLRILIERKSWLPLSRTPYASYFEHLLLYWWYFIFILWRCKHWKKDVHHFVSDRMLTTIRSSSIFLIFF